MNFSPSSLLLNNRTRILDVFEKWLQELDQIQHVDFQRATVCLLHLARIIEDANLVPSTSSSSASEDEEKFENEMAITILEEYSEVVYNAFRNMVSTTDIHYKNACLRMMIILKLASRGLEDLFYEVFPTEELEDFVKEHIHHPNELFKSRISFFIGEMLMEEKNDLPDIPIENILLPRLQRIKEIRIILSDRTEDVISCMNHISELSEYTRNPRIPIPTPDSPFEAESLWGTDECSEVGSILYLITVLNGYLHLSSTLIEFAEALAIAISENLIYECIEILKVPSVPVQQFAIITIGNAMVHRKLATDFIEMEGTVEVYKLVEYYRVKNGEDFKSFAAHATYLISGVFKHSAAVDLLVKPTNASLIVSFMFDLFLPTWDVVANNLSILDWCSEAIHHPLLLREIHASNVWKKVKIMCDQLLVFKVSPDKKESLFFIDHSRAIVTLCLKYIVASMFWGYQYSKSLFSDMDDLKPLSKSFGTLIRKNYIPNAGSVDIVQALLSSPAVIKIDEAEMFALEAYVFKSLIRTGHLPKGMTLDLFGRDSYSSTAQNANQFLSSSFAHAAANSMTTNSNSAQPSAMGPLLSGFEYDFPLNNSDGHQQPQHDIDLETQSVISMVTKVLPEWTIAASAIQEKIVPALFQIIMFEYKDSTTVCSALLCLQLLCVDAAVIVEIMQYDIVKYIDRRVIETSSELSGFQNKKGLEILLHLISSQERRDPAIMVSVLRLLAAMCAAPYFRYNGNDASVSQGFFEDYLKSPYFSAAQQLAAEKKKPFDTAKKQILSKLAYNPLENVQRSVRKSVRANAGISMLTQLLYYKKNMTYTVSIRLETMKILLGLQQDEDIKQILVKLRLPTILENQIQAEKSQTNMYDLNTMPQRLQDKALLQFNTDNLVNLLRGSFSHVHNTGVDGSSTGISMLDDAQEHLMRKTVVDHSNIDFSQFELLYLIRDHLASMGMSKSAAALESELIEKERQFNQRNRYYGQASSQTYASKHTPRSATVDIPHSHDHDHHHHDPHDPALTTANDTGSLSTGSKKRFRDMNNDDSNGPQKPSEDTTTHAQASSVSSSAKRLSVAFSAVANTTNGKANPVIFTESMKADHDNNDDDEVSPPPLKYSSSAKKASNSNNNTSGNGVLHPSIGLYPTSATPNIAVVSSSHIPVASAMKRPSAVSSSIPVATASSSTTIAAAATASTAASAVPSVSGRQLQSLLPVSKSQRRKNIAQALHSEVCAYVEAPSTTTTTTTTKNALSTSTSTHTMPPVSPTSSSSLPSSQPTFPIGLHHVHTVTAARTSSAGGAGTTTAAATAGPSSATNFITPNVNRYHSHPHRGSSSSSSSSSSLATTNRGFPTQQPPHSASVASRTAFFPTVDAANPFASTQSKLSTIMRRYLRLQHSQCKHPISTLPTMSLLKPHVCAKPPSLSFYNISRIVNRYEPVFANAQWMQQYRHEVYAGRLQHLYASSRTILTEEDEQHMITTCAFGQQSHHLWMAWYNDEHGPGVCMMNTRSKESLSEAFELDLPGMIDAFVFPDISLASLSLPNLAQSQQALLCAMVQTNTFTHSHSAGKEMYLYRDRDSAEVFESPALHKLSITAEDLRLAMSTVNPGYVVPDTVGEDDLKCFESAAFSRGTGRYLAASMVNTVIPMGAGFVFDIETGMVIHRLLNEASAGGGPTYEFPQVQYMPEEDHIVLLDGKLYDLRTNHTLHRFDKLSKNGNVAFHPAGYDVIIDSAIWDLRMFSLRQTVPLLENCRVQFDRFGGGVIAAMNMKDDDREFSEIREEYMGFHVLHPLDYSHIHTQNVVKAGQVSGFGLAEVKVDRIGEGLVAGILLAGNDDEPVSQCKVLEIGLRKRTGDEITELDDESDEDDDWQGSSSDNSNSNSEMDSINSDNDSESDSEDDEENEDGDDNDHDAAGVLIGDAEDAADEDEENDEDWQTEDEDEEEEEDDDDEDTDDSEESASSNEEEEEDESLETTDGSEDEGDPNDVHIRYVNESDNHPRRPANNNINILSARGRRRGGAWGRK